MSKVIDINKSLLLKNLNPEQIAGVTHDSGPILVIAGAGSGKTRVLAHRIAYLIKEKGVSPSNILAITFTNKAAGEMKKRIERLIGFGSARVMWISTFHSMCVRILRTHIERIGYKRNFVIYDAGDSVRLVTHCLRDLGIDTKQVGPRAVAARIGSLKNELIDPEGFAGDDYFESIVSKVYKMYQVKLFNNNALDFDDLLFFTVKLLKKAPDVLEAYQEQFHQILVDEYQDTNHAQYKIVSLLAAKRRNLFVVGDEDQSIYMWRGADIRNILEFELDYPEAKIVKLEKNYRSTKNILDAANSVVKNNINRKPKKLWTDNEEGSRIFKYQGLNEYEEATFVANEIYRLKEEEDIGPKDVAIFYRVNAQSRIIEEVFIRYGLAYKIVGGTKFYERKEVKDILAYLRLAINPRDSISLLRVINTPRRGIGKTTLAHLEEHAVKEGTSIWDAVCSVENVSKISPRAKKELVAFRSVIDELQRQIGVLKPSDFVELVYSLSGLMKEYETEHTIEAEGRIENLEQFLTGVKEFEAASSNVAVQNGRVVENATLDQFLERVALIADIDSLNDDQDAVTLMTAHNAKGLEFAVVFMVGMEDGVFPHMRSLYDSVELEEERRLCYVGITRAKEKLYMTHVSCRNVYGSPTYQMASRFLSEIPRELFESEEAPAEAPLEPQNVRKIDFSSPRIYHNFQIGQEVKHNKWGTGVVVNMINADDNSNAEIVINFPQVGEKRLLLAYAPLEPA